MNLQTSQDFGELVIWRRDMWATWLYVTLLHSNLVRRWLGGKKLQN